MNQPGLVILVASVFAAITHPVIAAVSSDLRWSAELFGRVDEERTQSLFNPDGGLLDGEPDVTGLAAHGVGRWQTGSLFARLDGWVEAQHAANDDSVRGILPEASLHWMLQEGHTLAGGLGSFRWGTAYLWNPSNPLADNALNNASRAHSYYVSGDRFVSYEVLAEQTTYLLAAVELTQRDALLVSPPQDERWLAARVQHVFDASDVAAHFALREGERFLGLSTSMTVGDALELHAELGTRSQRRFPLWSSLTVGPPPTPALPVWDTGARQHWTTSAIVGGQYTWNGGVNVILEYLYDGNGLDDSEYAALRAAASDAGSLRSDPAWGAAADGFLLQSNRYTGRMRRNYGFVRLAKDGLFSNTDVETYARRGLDDDSWIFGWLLRWQNSEHRSLALSGEHLRGSDISEAELIPVRNRYQISLKYDF